MSRNPGPGPPKRDFIGKPAPPGYVAGIGRGATGFTTRSDIGPAREAVASGSGGYGDGQGPSSKRLAIEKRPGGGANNDEDEEEQYLNESNYDEFAGYGGSLFNKDPYEDDDEEADKIYDAIDKHLDERGKALRETKTRQELEAYRQKRPKIQQQFMDLKANLKQVSEEEWMNIPEVGDARNRKQRVARQDKFTPLPDSLLAHQARLASGGEKLVYIDPKAMDVEQQDDEDDEDDDDADKMIDRKPIQPLDDGQALNIGEMSEFRSSYMSIQLSRVSSNANSKTDGAQSSSTNPQDYLTNLQSLVPNQITDTATVNEYRKQFASLRASNPTFQNAWIASVRLEEAAGKLKAARALILEACEKCPKSADLWLEAIRLHPSDISKALMVRAIKEIPRSVKLWFRAAELESDDEAKRRVFAKAREIIPKSVLLWKKSVELEPPERAKIILRNAVECCPDAVELWLALAKLEPYEEAKQVLVRAIEKNPKERSIWITAAKLQEQVGNTGLVESLIKRSIEELAEKGVEIKRDEWLREAIDANRANFKVTCREIIKRVIGWNISEEERLRVWLEDAKSFISDGSIDCARAVYSSIVEDKKYGKMESVWLEYVDFTRRYSDSPELLVQVLSSAVEPSHCPKSESLWLMLAKEKENKLDECRQILSEALDANPDSEKIVIQAVEMERNNGNHDEARRILADACKSARTAQLMMKAANLERSLGNWDQAQRLLESGVEEYKNWPEFYLSLGELADQRGHQEQAKKYYSDGLKFNPTSVSLWISMARLEESMGSIARARSRLEMARLRNPRVASLWLESAQLELRAFEARHKQSGGSSGGGGHARPDIVTTILAKGIKECKEGGPDVEKLYEMQSDLSSNRRKFQSS